jgi:hypothetical protein
MKASKLLVTFVPDGSVLKAIIGGLSSRSEALAMIDRIRQECADQDRSKVLIVTKLVASALAPADYAAMASHATVALANMRCAILVPLGREAGEEQVSMLTPNFRVYFDELKALDWLRS